MENETTSTSSYECPSEVNSTHSHFNGYRILNTYSKITVLDNCWASSNMNSFKKYLENIIREIIPLR